MYYTFARKVRTDYGVKGERSTSHSQQQLKKNPLGGHKVPSDTHLPGLVKKKRNNKAK